MTGRMLLRAMHLAGALAVLLCLSSAAAAENPAFSRLFGTISFQRPMNVFGQWIDVQKRNRADSLFSKAGMKLRANETTASLLSKA